jgi:hypothetical protein
VRFDVLDPAIGAEGYGYIAMTVAAHAPIEVQIFDTHTM